jgi:predicted aconitase with swiveling domain
MRCISDKKLSEDMKTSELKMKCHKISPGYGEGEALVSHETICFYLADPKTGRIREKGHQLEGKSVAGKVLIFPSGKASSAVQMDGLAKLMLNNSKPSAMIVQDVDAVLVSSAVLTGIPLVNRLEKDPFQVIETGDFVKVDSDRGIVSVIKQHH